MIPFSLHHSETWSHRPPCQTPGFCPFSADAIPWQVDVHLVDFQCFGKGLRTTKMANHFKPENLQCDLRQSYKAMSTTKHIWSQDHESKSMFMSRSLVLMSADDLPAGRFLDFWMDIRSNLISIEANHNLSTCQKETYIFLFSSPFILILVKVFQLSCALVLVRQSQ